MRREMEQEVREEVRAKAKEEMKERAKPLLVSIEVLKKEQAELKQVCGRACMTIHSKLANRV